MYQLTHFFPISLSHTHILSLLPSPPPLSLQLIGLALILFGICLLVGDNTLQVLTGSEFASDGALILVAGVITGIISFVRIFGAA
ncbi:MAG: hypothetical protein MJE68_33235 [Proteobacteria bacterium]|nr:hypothetical protein [Pseudomonadota bacterium]